MLLGISNIAEFQYYGVNREVVGGKSTVSFISSMLGVTYNEHRGCQEYLPKPMIEMLGNPNSINLITNDNKKIELGAGDV
jgi:hypothetical protein